MSNLSPHHQKSLRPASIFSIISVDAGIFGWLVGIFILLTSFTPLSAYFPFGRVAAGFLLAMPGISWATAILSGMLAVRQYKGKGSTKETGPARWGIVISGIGCALLYGFFLLIALGFYILISKGYIGFMLRSIAPY